MKEKLLKESLLDACQASYIPFMEKGRETILELPRGWVLKNIHCMAMEILNLSDEWEYRRLLELYKKLDKNLLINLVNMGLKNDNEDIKEAANDFKEVAG
jgi:hypothetical protein